MQELANMTIVKIQITSLLIRFQFRILKLFTFKVFASRMLTGLFIRSSQNKRIEK